MRTTRERDIIKPITDRRPGVFLFVIVIVMTIIFAVMFLRSRVAAQSEPRIAITVPTSSMYTGRISFKTYSMTLGEATFIRSKIDSLLGPTVEVADSSQVVILFNGYRSEWSPELGQEYDPVFGDYRIRFTVERIEL